MDKIFIIILNWNRPDDTVLCINSIRKLSLKNYQLSVVVVDNGSSDDSKERLKGVEMNNADFRLLVNSCNLGFAGGNNVGIDYAIKNGAKYILVLNNDTEVEKDSLGVMLRMMDEDLRWGVVSPKIYFAKGFEFHQERYQKSQLGRVIWYAGGVIDWKNIYGANRGVDEVDVGQFDECGLTDFSTGACSLLRVDALKETGMYDEKYFMYLEDVDLSERLKRRGWKVGYCGSTAIWHRVAQSSGIGSDLNDYFITRNRLLFGAKYASLRSRVALVKESIKFLLSGRRWQKVGVGDYYLGRFGKGAWRE